MIDHRVAVTKLMRLVAYDNAELDIFLFYQSEDFACFPNLVIVDNCKHTSIVMLELMNKRLFLVHLNEVKAKLLIQFCSPLRA